MESANLQHQLQELFVGYSSLASVPRIPSISAHEGSPSIIFDANSYNNPYVLDQSVPFSRENEINPWFNFSSTLYSSLQSPANYGGFQGMGAGSNTNVFNPGFLSSRNSNTSTLDLLSSSSFSMGYNLQADHQLDLLSATNYSSGFHKNGSLYGYDVQFPVHSPSNSSNKASSVGRAKRAASEPKKSNPESKKSCSSRSSCPPLKVRKEKLGDRISALQRLVAPFGKTDTSSVLTEAIGYIQFLHDQVETLSMPYLKPSQSKPYHKLQSVSVGEDGTRPRQDLGSRGLCLMPVSCLSFMHGCD